MLEYKSEELEIYKAEKMGFCGGVTLAVRKIRGILDSGHEGKLVLLDEIIHNPDINEEFKKRGIVFLPEQRVADESEEDAVRRLITSNDTAIIPAFGASVGTYSLLARIGCKVVDTTCPSVKRVWKKVIEYRDSGFTTLYYGKKGHQEAEATVSRAGKYLIFSDDADLEKIVGFYQGAVSETDFLAHFNGRYSEGFNPAEDMKRIGLAAQTTMLKNKIGDYFRKISTAFPNNAAENLRMQDTVCAATQVRQDAVVSLCESVDIMIVIGGYNSSNTSHLAKIAGGKIGNEDVYHIEGPACFTQDSISYLPVGSKNGSAKKAWLPDKMPLRIGITSGASTPNEAVAEAIEKLKGFYKH